MRQSLFRQGVVRQLSHKNTCLRRSSTFAALAQNTYVLYDGVFMPETDENVLNSRLVDMLKDGKYASARTLMTEMHITDVPVHQHPIFEAPALRVLQEGKHNSHFHFSSWLMYAPDAHHPLSSIPNEPPFPLIYDWLFAAGLPARKLRFVTQFGTLMAWKGYHTDFVHEASRLVARYSDPDSVRHYFQKTEKLTLRYYKERRRLDPSEPPPFPNKGAYYEDPAQVARRLRQIAVEMCVEVDRLEQAVEVAELQRKIVYTLPDSTYARIMDCFGPGDDRGLVERVAKLRAEDARWRVLNEGTASDPWASYLDG